MKSIWTNAISLAQNLEQVDYVLEKLKTTSQFNRRTKQGREITEEIKIFANDKAQLLISNGEIPF